MIGNYDDVEDLLGAIEWEGGIPELIDYGITELPEHFDPILKEGWTDIAETLRELNSRIDYFDRAVIRLKQEKQSK